MATLSSCVRRFSPTLFVLRRTIMTTNSRLQKAMENLQDNPYFDKYASKIKKLQQASPDEFLAKAESLPREKSPSVDDAKKRYDSMLKPKAPLVDKSAPSDRKLGDIFKIELVRDKSAEEIAAIWRDYHLQKEDSIVATIPKDVFKKIEDRGKKYPTFLFPLPRSQGYEFVMFQMSGNVLHFTTLLSYQVHKENAPECLTIVHYKELMDDKGIVLMKGEYDKNVLSAKEAQCLANHFQMYYGQEDADRLTLLDQFTNHPNTFKHMDLITQMENIQLT